MLLSDIFEQLTYGEYAELFIGGAEAGAIDPSQYRKVVAHTNSALRALHIRLPLRLEEVLIQQYDHISNYYLRPQFAVQNTASIEPYKYIIDSPYAPFQDNVIKIEQVFSEVGEEYPLNDSLTVYSVYTPQFDQLQIPFAKAENACSVIFRANHPKIVWDAYFNPAEVDIDVPEYLMDPILLYMSSRMASNEAHNDQKSAATLALQKYEKSVVELSNSGLIQEEQTTNNRLVNNGWV